MAEPLYIYSRNEAVREGRLAELSGPDQEQTDGPAQGGMEMR